MVCAADEFSLDGEAAVCILGIAADHVEVDDVRGDVGVQLPRWQLLARDSEFDCAGHALQFGRRVGIGRH